MTETNLQDERLRRERLRNQALQRLAQQRQAQQQGQQDGQPRPETQGVLQQAQQMMPQGGQEGDPRFVDRSGITTALEIGLPTVGGALGVPLGPAGMIGGGVMGAMAARGASNIARDLEDIVTRGEEPDRTLAQQSLDMLQAGTEELAFGTGFHVLGRAASNVMRFAGRLSGAQSPEVASVIADAREGNLGVGPIDLNKPFYNIASRVGGVMPLVGGPIRTAGEVKGVQVSREFTGTLNDISPAVDLTKLGVRFAESGRKALEARRTLSNARYQEMRELFQQAGEPAVVPTAPIKRRVAEVIGEMDDLPRTQRREQVDTGLVGPEGRALTRGETRQGEPVGITPLDEPFVDQLRAFLELPEQVSPRHLERLQGNLNRAARGRSGNTMKSSEYRVINDVNAATWDALEAIPEGALEPQTRRALLESVRSAKKSWADLRGLEETAAAAQFKRADRNFFSAGFEKAGSAEVDELANLYVGSQSTLRSPQFIEDLEALIGPDNRKALARAVLRNAAAPQEGLARVARATNPERMFFPSQRAGGGATDVVVFNAGDMRKRLGLTDPEGLLGEGAVRQNRKALGRLLKDTPVSVDRLDSFLKTTEQIQQSPIGDPSVFLTRKITLGGTPKSLVPGDLAAGAATAASLTGSLFSLGVFTMTGRAFSRLISTPRGLQILREGMEPNLTRQQALNLASRVSRLDPNSDVQLEGQWSNEPDKGLRPPRPAGPKRGSAQ